MRKLFEWTGATVPGRDHRRAFRNSQDAWYVEASPDLLVAVVCDGCGSAPHSEVGAKIGARLVARQMTRWITEAPEFFGGESLPVGLNRVRRSVLSQVQVLADSMSGSFSQVISDYFLFTVLGAVIRPAGTFLFGAADGVFWVNGEETRLEAGNEPPYPMYGLIRTEKPVESSFFLYRSCETPEVVSIGLGSDGAMDLSAASEKPIPGKAERIGPVSQFWTEDRYFRNPFALGHRLNLINREYRTVDYDGKRVNEEHGPLSDDTTLVVVRRKSR